MNLIGLFNRRRDKIPLFPQFLRLGQVVEWTRYAVNTLFSRRSMTDGIGKKQLHKMQR